ncbi:MAG: M15 family metallopeptidase [Bacilli bacterium]|nr:M15 family metallopeptidase [Bacilli bacterium]
MKKLLIYLLFILLLSSCGKVITISNKQIIPQDFTNKISKYSTYKDEYLNYYYYTYLDYPNKTYIEILNYVNYPSFYDFSKPAKALNINGLLLVNRKFYLEEDYYPSNLVSITGVNYVKRENEVMMINEDVLKAYKEMEIFAKQKNINFTIFSSFRSYQKQLSLWNPSRPASDKFLAKPGFSEHQTGLVLDISTLDKGLTIHFEDSPSFNFLESNAHKFGFILRYPKGKEHITGYAYEPWHYRYVGKEVAYIIWKEKLTLEEYFYKYLLL